MTTLRATHYRTGATWEFVAVEQHLDQITITPAASVLGNDFGNDFGNASDLWLAPGMFDLQINGRAGFDFLEPELEPRQLAEMVARWDEDGVARGLATVTTQSRNRLITSLERISRAIDAFPEVACRVAGVHLEGPYLSSQDGPRGAHPREHIRPPDFDEFQRFQQASGGRIRLLTLSPEYPESPEFIRQVVATGVLVSIGHTAATRDELLAAIDAGASLSTHLGNGCHGQLPRHPNSLWDQLADDRLTAMVIADGHHLPDEVLKCFVRCKRRQRILAVSDMTGMGGMPPGRYERTALGAVEVLENGRLVVAGQRQYLAGAAAPLWQAIARLTNATDLSLSEAIEACTLRPADLFRESIEPSSDPTECCAALLDIRTSTEESTGSPKIRIELVGFVRDGRLRRFGAD